MWQSLTSCTQSLIYKNEIVVAFGFAHFPWSIFCLGFISFTFLTILLFLPFDFSFRVYPLYIFKFFWFFLVFQEYGTPLLKKEGLNIFHSSIKKIMKYETYWYRSLTEPIQCVVLARCVATVTQMRRNSHPMRRATDLCTKSPSNCLLRPPRFLLGLLQSSWHTNEVLNLKISYMPRI